MTEPVLKHNRTRIEPAGQAEQITPLVRRMVAPNGSPFTYTGTCTYIVGKDKVAIIDPGPDNEAHVQALLRAVAGQSVDHIVITHTHKDHSPASRALQQATGAKIVGCAAFVPAKDRPRGGLDSSHDTDYTPDEEMFDGDALHGAGFTLQAIATPGHASNHLAFALREENTVFSGDHVMAWSTSIVAPPDGSMQDYMRSLDKLLVREDSLYWPGHGDAVEEPQAYVNGLVHHRKLREAAIRLRIEAGDSDIATMVANIYVGYDDKLQRAAALSVLAHLEDMVERGVVATDGPATLASAYRIS